MSKIKEIVNVFGNVKMPLLQLLRNIFIDSYQQLIYFFVLHHIEIHTSYFRLCEAF